MAKAPTTPPAKPRAGATQAKGRDYVEFRITRADADDAIRFDMRSNGIPLSVLSRDFDSEDPYERAVAAMWAGLVATGVKLERAG